MTKEKLLSLQSYKEALKARLTSPIPDKHKDHPDTFKAYLNNEIRLVSLKIQQAELEGAK